MAEPRTSSRSRTSTRTPKAPAETSRKRSASSPIDPDQRRGMIAEAAYYRAERRGFQPGGEDADWLAAESEVDTQLTLKVPLQSN